MLRGAAALLLLQHAARCYCIAAVTATIRPSEGWDGSASPEDASVLVRVQQQRLLLPSPSLLGV